MCRGDQLNVREWQSFVSEADLFLHVVDAKVPDIDRRLQAVHQVIADMNLQDTPEIVVLNQIDCISPEEAEQLAAQYNAIAVSALKRRGLSQLLEEVHQRLFKKTEAADNATSRADLSG